MGYSIAALVARMDVLTADGTGLPVVELGDGWGLVPLPERDPDPDPDVPPVVGDVEATVRRLSAAGAVAYVRAEIVGGHGTQWGEVWRDGSTVFGPVEGWIGSGKTPISQTLRALGVRAFLGDEFTKLRLGRHRHTADWLADAVRR
jgi:hypothetical protein